MNLASVAYVAVTTATSFAAIASPATFTLAPGATKVITFTATPNTALTVPVFGMVTGFTHNRIIRAVGTDTSSPIILGAGGTGLKASK